MSYYWEILQSYHTLRGAYQSLRMCICLTVYWAIGTLEWSRLSNSPTGRVRSVERLSPWKPCTQWGHWRVCYTQDVSVLCQEVTKTITPLAVNIYIAMHSGKTNDVEITHVSNLLYKSMYMYKRCTFHCPERVKVGGEFRVSSSSKFKEPFWSDFCN